MDFEQVIHNLFGPNKQNLRKQFEEEKCHTKKFLILRSSDNFNKVLKLKLENENGKDLGVCERLRNEGNKLFQAGDFKRAIEKFSSAALKTPFDNDTEDQKGKHISRPFSLAIANRSLALVKLGKYEQALEDIDLALKSGYPEESHHKLWERRAKCCVHLGRPKEAAESLDKAIQTVVKANINEKEKAKIKTSLTNDKKNIIAVDSKSTDEIKPNSETFSEKSNCKVPAFSSHIKIAYDDVRGRYGVATRDLSPGHVILQESPVAAVLKPQFCLQYCDTCLTRVTQCPVPCPRCCHVVYCSATCRDVSLGSYHPYECCQNISTRWTMVNDHLCQSQTELSLTHHLLCYRFE